MKPALQRHFMFEFYQREHNRLPGHGIEGRKRLQKKRRSVILRWWNRLPPDKRNTLIAQAERAVAKWNDVLRSSRHEIQHQIDEIQERIDEYKRRERYASR